MGQVNDDGNNFPITTENVRLTADTPGGPLGWVWLKPIMDAIAGKLSTVATDNANITGNGTTGSPLKVLFPQPPAPLVFDSATITGNGTSQKPYSVANPIIELSIADWSELDSVYTANYYIGHHETEGDFYLQVGENLNDAVNYIFQMRLFGGKIEVRFTNRVGGVWREWKSTEGLEAVSTNNTLTGNGTPNNPLGLHPDVIIPSQSIPPLIPEIRVSSITNTLGERLLYLEPFYLPENLRELNPTITVRRQRFIFGGAKQSANNPEGRGASKNKWCDVNPSVGINIYPPQKPILAPLEVPLNAPQATNGQFLKFPNNGNPITTEKDMCQAFFHFVDFGQSQGVQHGSYQMGIKTKGNFSGAKDLVYSTHPGESHRFHGTLGFCLRIDNPAFREVLALYDLTPETWRGANYNLVPRYLYGKVCRMFMSVFFRNDGYQTYELTYSLKPKR